MAETHSVTEMGLDSVFILGRVMLVIHSFSCLLSHMYFVKFFFFSICGDLGQEYNLSVPSLIGGVLLPVLLNKPSACPFFPPFLFSCA